MEEIILGSMLDIPVSRLTTSYEELLKSLTVRNPKYASAKRHGNGFVSKSISENLFFFKTNPQRKSIIVPRCIDPKYYRGNPDRVVTSKGSRIPIGQNPNFSLRDYQEEYFQEQVIPYIDNHKPDEAINLLLNAECGSGKTVMSLYLCSIYKVKSIVVVPQKKLGKQFIARVKELFPNWTCGWVEDGKTYDINLATYSLLSQPKYNLTFFSQFGHIVFDEFHRCGADSYKEVLEKACCHYRTTLTATFRRKDGLHSILKVHIGGILEMESNSIEADVYPLNTKYTLNEIDFKTVNRFAKTTKTAKLFSEILIKDRKTKEEVCRGMIISKSETNNSVTVSDSTTKANTIYSNKDFSFFSLGSVSLPMMDTKIAGYEERNNDALDLIIALTKAGRKTIVLSKRKAQLFSLYGKLKRRGILAGVVISEKAKEYKDHCKKLGRTIEENAKFVFEEADVLLGIDKLAEEGMDTPDHDTIIYLHPIRDTEQSIGRIGRHKEGKKKPLAFFFIDKVKTYENTFYGKESAKWWFEELNHVVHDPITFEQAKHLIKIEQHGKI